MRAGASKDGQTLARTKSVPTPQTYQEGIAALTSLYKELAGDQSITAVTIAFPALMDATNSQLLRVPNLPDWTNKPLVKDFGDKVGITPLIRNDAELAGLGEAQFGAGQKFTSLIYITISTGVGGAWVQRQGGTAVSANIEPGHEIVIDDDGPNCLTCNIRGHLESYISGSGLAAKYHVQAKQISDPKVWEQVLHYTAQGISKLLKQYPAEGIVLGGALVLHDRIPLDGLARELTSLLGKPSPLLIKAELGDQAGLYGALYLAAKP